MSVRRAFGAVAAVVFLVLLVLHLTTRQQHTVPLRVPAGDAPARAASGGPSTAEADVDGCEATSKPLPPDQRNIIASRHTTATTIYAYDAHMECSRPGIGLWPHQPETSYPLAAGAEALTVKDGQVEAIPLDRLTERIVRCADTAADHHDCGSGEYRITLDPAGRITAIREYPVH
ncbi:hypothetical protein ACFV6F_31555 [Kitasatospora phosalacinea]|uniref:hypothetical protein n=1 Tax=Kitasatospora phosalacinea TaxID=2065 RepID=UPI00365ABF74